MEEIKNLENRCQENNLLLKVNKTKELLVNFTMKKEKSYHILKISAATVENVDSFRYLGVHITQNLCHINILVKKASQRLNNLRP